MEEVLYYLNLKNQYLEKFLAMTQKFLAQVTQDKWDDIELFVDNRERILNIIHTFDAKMASVFEELDITSYNLELYRPRVKEIFQQREELAKKIVDTDLELVSKMEEIKIETIRELKKHVQTTHQISSFVNPTGRRTAKPKDM